MYGNHGKHEIGYAGLSNREFRSEDALQREVTRRKEEEKRRQELEKQKERERKLQQKRGKRASAGATVYGGEGKTASWGEGKRQSETSKKNWENLRKASKVGAGLTAAAVALVATGVFTANAVGRPVGSWFNFGTGSNKTEATTSSASSQTGIAANQVNVSPYSGELENGVHYDLSDYAGVNGKKYSPLSFGPNRVNELYGHEKETKNANYDAAYDDPAILAAYAVNSFSIIAKHNGLEGKTSNEVLDMLNNDANGGELQDALLGDLEVILQASSTEFMKKNGTVITDNIKHEATEDGSFSPRNMTIGYNYATRVNAPVVRYTYPDDILERADGGAGNGGTNMVSTDLHLSCYGQGEHDVTPPNTEDFTEEDQPADEPDTPFEEGEPDGVTSGGPAEDHNKGDDDSTPGGTPETPSTPSGGGGNRTPTPPGPPTPPPKPVYPTTEHGKSGDPHGDGEDNVISEAPDKSSLVTKEESEDANKGNQAYVDDNKATPGSSSENNGVNKNATSDTGAGFASSGISATGADTSGTRLDGGAKQTADENGRSETAGTNKSQVKIFVGDDDYTGDIARRIEEAEARDRVSNQNQAKAQSDLNAARANNPENQNTRNSQTPSAAQTSASTASEASRSASSYGTNDTSSAGAQSESPSSAPSSAPSTPTPSETISPTPASPSSESPAGQNNYSDAEEEALFNAGDF